MLSDLLIEHRSISFKDTGNIIVAFRRQGKITNPKSKIVNTIKAQFTARFRKRPLGVNCVKRKELKHLFKAKNPHLTLAQCEVFINIWSEMLKRVLLENVRIELRGFGSFNPMNHKIRNSSEESVVITFHPFDNLIEDMNASF
jgi:nucleoid DNA-binding protein